MQHQPEDQLRTAAFQDLAVGELYAILKLRSDVFVVEQACVYPDLDGRDTEPGTRHLWVERDHRIRAYVRILDDGDAQRVGRVVTAPDARGTGLAGRLLAEALRTIGDRTTVLDAQSHLAGWYARFGFARRGPDFVEDGIPHTPMIKAA